MGGKHKRNMGKSNSQGSHPKNELKNRRAIGWTTILNIGRREIGSYHHFPQEYAEISVNICAIVTLVLRARWYWTTLCGETKIEDQGVFRKCYHSGEEEV